MYSKVHDQCDVSGKDFHPHIDKSKVDVRHLIGFDHNVIVLV